MDPHVREALSSLLDFGRIMGTALTSSKKSMTATIAADENDDGTAEQLVDQEMWGIAGIASRPQPPTGEDGAEVLLWRRGDELVGISWRDLRWQVEVIEGEVAVYALGRAGPRQATLRCRPSGEVLVQGVAVNLDGTNVKIGNTPAALQAIGLGGILQLFVNVFWAWTPVPNDGGAALKAALTAIWASPPTVGSSKHNVEP